MVLGLGLRRDGMKSYTALWERLDIPGKEGCTLTSLEEGWRLSGFAVFVYEEEPYVLTYKIFCDEVWQTLSAEVHGWGGDRNIETLITREPSGIWRLNGDEQEMVAGCTDIDLNFSPSTNMLPIRRLNLAVGDTAPVRAAWLRFPSFELEPLEQSYTRLGERLYGYESAGGRFVATVGVDEVGMVTNYGEIWKQGWGPADLPCWNPLGDGSR
jgi:hypothetical protein